MGGKKAVIELLRDLIVGLEHRVRALEEEASKPAAPSRPRLQPWVKAGMDRNPKLPAQARGAGGGQVTEFTLGSPKVIES